MDAGNVSAVISACAGIAGVLLGNGFVFLKEMWLTEKERTEDAAYLVVLVVAHLDAAANACLQAAFDIGVDKAGAPAGGRGGFWAPTTTVELVNLHELDVNWKALPVTLMRDTLRLSGELNNFERSLVGLRDDESEYPEFRHYFWLRRGGYAHLGLRVLDVAKALRKHTGLMSADDFAEDLLIREDLVKVVKALEQDGTSGQPAS